MFRTPEPPSPLPLESNVKSVLEWLALAHGRSGSDDAEALHQQLLSLRESPLPCAQRLKLLDLLYGQAQRIALHEARSLNEISLPISRKLRQRLRILLDLLATLTQDYFNTLAEIFDPQGPSVSKIPHLSLRRAMHTIAWQLRVTQLIAAPNPIGLWQQLHSAFSTARRLGLDEFPGPNGSACIRRLYTNILLAAIAQPSSFSSGELEFIGEYIANSTPDIKLTDTPPRDRHGIFWIDASRDFPGHALTRRIPGPDTPALYFACDEVAEVALRHHQELLKGASSEALGLPAFADTHTGPGVLLRLNQLWGHPAKRKFPRRRQSYRAHLCPGLDNLWKLIKFPGEAPGMSEWMVINESPEGYALMHMSGHTQNLRVGDIVAMQATDDRVQPPQTWHICLIRWAISENPEHIEIGLQILAPKAVAVEVATPTRLESGKAAALILPATPPLRPHQSLVVPTGLLDRQMRRVVILLEGNNLNVRELRPTGLDEQSSSVEIFSVSSDDST